jgi:TPR repeat protein
MTTITVLPRAFLVACALILFCPPAGAQGASPAEVKTLSDAILKKPAWINETSACPAQIMQARPARATPNDEACYDTPTAACLARCESGSADACYWLGQGLQGARALELAYESLYQRACKLGNASACTNRAASILSEGNKDPQATSCALSTFEKTCAQDDPWGCTMLGMHLVRGIGTSPDPQRALQVMNRSCRLGEDDPACKAAKDLRAQAQRMLKDGQQKK